MTSLSAQASVRHGEFTIATTRLVRATAVVAALLLVAAVELVAENYFDPQHRLNAAQMIPQP